MISTGTHLKHYFAWPNVVVNVEILQNFIEVGFLIPYGHF